MSYKMCTFAGMDILRFMRFPARWPLGVSSFCYQRYDHSYPCLLCTCGASLDLGRTGVWRGCSYGTGWTVPIATMLALWPAPVPSLPAPDGDTVGSLKPRAFVLFSFNWVVPDLGGYSYIHASAAIQQKPKCSLWRESAVKCARYTVPN